jgi:phage portal protein BeeE
MSQLTDYRMHELRHWDYEGTMTSRTPSGIRVNADNSMACSAYTACIRVISDAVSSLPLHLFEKLANGGKRKVSDDPLYRVLHTQPNPWQTAQEFRDWMTGLYLHYGASYAEIRTTGRGLLELWPLHSSRMEVERLEDGSLRYKYREPGTNRYTIYRQEQIFCLRFTTEDGVHPIPTYKLFENVIGWRKRWRRTPPRSSATTPGRGSCLKAKTRSRWKRPSGSASSGSACTVAQTARSAPPSCLTA